ncbi:NAD(P)/FAD-dependent oxidoreductase [Cellulomonas fimi]|uniref:NAD(P)/FAD-dependent oxidoreductase n=1 Tax=Cellulomonas fimi TaxID=1708 RepID=A0A7Y0M1J1_CELFI|nr:NAD(P)/FAD-dependent oxidoreductase [Cellulomonas fimi]NMR20737.1 NAD(P)/FAD-dependent oxidoreductase [Cellulomonas fimi]
MTPEPALDRYDVVVVGGGAAGLSAAVVLARAGRAVLVVDAGEHRNASAEAVHGLLALDGVRPADLISRGRDEVHAYGGEVVHGRVVSAGRAPDGFSVVLEGGAVVPSRRLLVATGLVDELPDVPGVRARWGRDVLHCPYCHGHEVRGRAIGVLATGPEAVHQALVFRQWSPDVVLLRHSAAPPTDAEREQLEARDVVVVEGHVDGLVTEDDRLVGVRLASGELMARDVVAVSPRGIAQVGSLTSLGLATTDRGSCVVLEADARGRTTVPGVWAAGNVVDPAAQVVGAAAAGAQVGAALNTDLVDDDVARAVDARRRNILSTR